VFAYSGPKIASEQPSVPAWTTLPPKQLQSTTTPETIHLPELPSFNHEVDDNLPGPPSTKGLITGTPSYSSSYVELQDQELQTEIQVILSSKPQAKVPLPPEHLYITRYNVPASMPPRKEGSYIARNILKPIKGPKVLVCENDDIVDLSPALSIPKLSAITRCN
jgi:hypothetical protein